MVEIIIEATLERFRMFLIYSTCRSYIPESYFHDPDVFPERESGQGAIYIEATDKASLKKIRDISFVDARDVLGVIYESKSGNTKLRWRQIGGSSGRVTGIASANALTNLINSGVVTLEYVEEVVSGMNAPSGEKKSGDSAFESSS
jgi:hypothetical protein